MWEVCRDKVEASGSKVHMQTRVTKVRHADGRAVAVVSESGGVETEYPCTEVISSMPMSALLRAMDPPVPAEVRAAADDLAYRDFLTVALVVPESAGFPDNWIYIHSPEVEVGRIQNFGSWSPYLVKDGRTCLGMEYFVFEGDELWNSSDEDLVALATRELGVHRPRRRRRRSRPATSCGCPRPTRSTTSATRPTSRSCAAGSSEHAPNVHPVGRNGMHRYNNQDHSMYTAMLTVENILEGTHHDVWEVNVEEEYHEESSPGERAEGSRAAPGATPRSSPARPSGPTTPSTGPAS